MGGSINEGHRKAMLDELNITVRNIKELHRIIRIKGWTTPIPYALALGMARQLSANSEGLILLSKAILEEAKIK